MKPTSPSLMSGEHGDHEGGWPGECWLCAILSQLEVIELIANTAIWDEEP